MPNNNRKRRQPSYRHHKPSDQAVVTIDGRDIYLGPYDSPESHEKYSRHILEWQARHSQATAGPAPISHRNATLSVNEMLLECWQHFESYYSHDGKPTSEATNMLVVVKLVQQLYGLTLAAEFGPKTLKNIRQHMIDVQGLARTEINKRIGRIKRVFKHAVSEELIPPGVFHGLEAVAGLRYGQGNVRETEPVGPAPDLAVCQVLPFVSRQVATMILVQRVTGMRPGEVVIMRPCDIDTRRQTWEYRPYTHKNKWRNRTRVIPLGPYAQSLLKPFMTRQTKMFLFSPREAEEERNAIRRQNRRSPMTPSQSSRKPKKQPLRATRERYDRNSYHRAIMYGMKKARREGFIVPHWHPHQLRHTHGTAVRRVYGAEEAQVSLGTGTDVIEVYAEQNHELAVKVAKKMG